MISKIVFCELDNTHLRDFKKPLCFAEYQQHMLNPLNNISYILDLKNQFLHEFFSNSLLWCAPSIEVFIKMELSPQIINQIFVIILSGMTKSFGLSSFYRQESVPHYLDPPDFDKYFQKRLLIIAKASVPLAKKQTLKKLLCYHIHDFYDISPLSLFSMYSIHSSIIG